MQKIAIIQLGDWKSLLFSFPSIQGIKKKYPDSFITLITKKENKDLLDSLFFIDYVQLVENVSSVDYFESQNLLINLSSDDLSLSLCGIIKSDEKIGALLNDKNEIEISDYWSQYFYSVVGRTFLNPFHLVDIYKYITKTTDFNNGLELSLNSESIVIAKSLINYSPGIRLGLSVTNDWSIDAYKNFLQIILGYYPNAKIYAFIEDSARVYEQELLQFENIIVIPFEKNFQLWLALVNEMHLVAGPLSDLIHIASCCGTLTISTSVLDQPAFEKSPYGHGHVLILEETENLDKQSISPEIVAQSVLFAIEGNNNKPPVKSQWKEFYSLINDIEKQPIQAYICQRIIFENQENQERTDLILEPILQKNTTALECLYNFYRIIWQYELNNSADTLENLNIKNKSTIDGINTLINSLEKLHKLAGFGIKYSSFILDGIKNSDMQNTQTDSQRLGEIDNYIQIMADTVPAISPICNFYKIHQYQNIENDLEKIAVKSVLSYQRIERCVLIMLDLIEASLKSMQKKMQKEAVNEQIP